MPAAVQRFDRSPLGAIKKLPAGGIRIDGNISRTGIQIYSGPDGSERREYRPPEEVFAAESLDSLGAAPVTRGHPGAVDPSTWKQHAIGTVSDVAPRREAIAGAEFVVQGLNVQDGPAIAAVERRDLAEISAGYSTILDETPGTTPAGERYDAVQRTIRYNHVALLPTGQARAGRAARLRLDGNQDTLSEEAKIMPEPTPPIVKITLDGIQYVEGSSEHVKALEKQRDAALAKIADVTAKLDAANVALAAARADAGPDRLDSAVDALLTFRARVAPVLPKGYEFKGKTRATIVADALKALPGVTLAADATDATRELYLTARLDALPGHDYNRGDREDGDTGAPRTSVDREKDFHSRLDGAYADGINGGAAATDRGAKPAQMNKGAK